MMALVVLEGVIVAILAVLVVGLLRSHAEILRRLHELGGGQDRSGSDHDTPVDLRPPAAGDGTAHDIVGETPTGEVAAVGVVGAGHATLLAFLSSGCSTCARFWEAFARPDRLGLAPGTRVVAVTRGPELESPTAIGEVAPPDLTVVMSTQGWHDYRVPGAPYFVLVDGPARAVVGEGTGTDWAQVESLIRHSRGDRRRNRGRMDSDDAELLAAGIGPGHASLFAARPGPDRPEDGAPTSGRDR